MSIGHNRNMLESERQVCQIASLSQSIGFKIFEPHFNGFIFGVFDFFHDFLSVWSVVLLFFVGYPQLATGIEPATTTSIMVLYIAGYHVHRGLQEAFGVPLLFLL
jgi:hypothetical protein